jgi:hypothetical protein
MAQCKICGKKYHACSSCGLQFWEYEYCSEKCRDEGWLPRVNYIINLLKQCPLGTAKELAHIMTDEVEDILEMAGRKFNEP